ncbi:MAG TPA: DUF4136 domain-containing protein [Cyclobacteriaceae bacterium]|nr:DUF4136 domain-containing protein [Cyclobacteriaceae bacterium]
MKSRLKWMMIGMVYGLISCQTVPTNIELVQSMLVQTTMESTADFSSYASYSLALDTLGYFTIDDPLDSVITGSYAQQVTAQIRFNMDKAGYTRVANDQNPNLAVSAFILRDYGVIQSLSYPGYYSTYSGIFYPKCYGFKNYYGYPYLNNLNFNTATLVIEIIDMKNKDTQGKSKLLWTAYIGDLINTVDINSRTISAVDDSFAQSKYIKK